MADTRVKDKRLDCYEQFFGRGEEDLLIQDVNEMEENSEWISDIQSNSISLEAIDGPLFAKDASEKYHLDYELALDTADNGTNLVVAAAGEYQLLRDTARSSLCETAKLYGSALGRMTPYLFAETINNGLQVARGTTLMLVRYGKASAMHSNAEGGYARMPISELLGIVTNVIGDRFGTGDFITGYNTHGYTRAIWELPDVQEHLLKMYERALGGSSKYPIAAMPALRFASSDTAASCATLEPVFYTAKTNIPIRFVDGLRVRHTKRLEKPAMQLFEEGAAEMFARFEESAEVIEKLSETPIYNGCNAVVSVCKKLGIAKKYGEAARVEMERLTVGGSVVTAHDLYLCLTEAVAEAIRSDAPKTVINDMEENLAKVLKADWSEHDVGGIVAWAA